MLEDEGKESARSFLIGGSPDKLGALSENILSLWAAAAAGFIGACWVTVLFGFIIVMLEEMSFEFLQ